MRGLPRGTVLVVCGVALAAAQVVLALSDAASWLRLIGVLLPLVVAAGFEVDNLRSKRAAKAEADRKLRQELEQKWLTGVEASLWRWPPPSVGAADLRTLTALAPHNSTRPAAIPVVRPYVPRDVDRLAAERLRAHGVLLLIGAPSSGVTRTAYELAKADPVNRLLVAPLPPTGLTSAFEELDVLSRLAPPKRLMLWLDRIDRFSPGGVSVSILRRCQEQSPGFRAIATIPSTRYAAWAAEEPELAAAFGDPVKIERLLTARERERANDLYPDLNIEEGIAAAFTSTGAILRLMRVSYEACPYEISGRDCALTQAVVEVATGWANTGTPRGLPTKLLAELAAHRLHEPQPDSAHLDHVLDWATGPNREGALLTRDNSDDGTCMVRMHPAVAEIRKEEWSPTDEELEAAALTDARVAGDSEAVGRIGFHAHTRGLTETAAKAWATITTVDEPGARWLKRAAEFSRGRHQPIGQIPPLERLLQLLQADNRSHLAVTLVTLNDLGRASLDAAQPAKARDLFEQALRVKEREYGPDSIEVATTVLDLGTAWRDLRMPTKARDFSERALQIFYRVHGPNSTQLAVALGNLGNCWRDLGESAKARDLHQRALLIEEREYGPNHIKVARTLSNLGNCWRDLGEPAKARDLHQRALLIEEREYGPNHLKVAPTLSNLANDLDALDEPGKARDLLQRALLIEEREYGPNSSQVGSTLSNLGNAWRDMGEVAQARDLFQRALLIKERACGPDNPELTVALCNLGNALLSLGEPARARDLNARALRIAEAAHGQDHPLVASVQNSLGNALRDLGQTAQARELYERALRTLRARLPGGHPSIRVVANNLRRVAPEIIVFDDARIVPLTETDDSTKRWRE